MPRIPVLLSLTAAMLLAGSAASLGHEAGKGRNGGLRVDAGKYHTELVVNGTTTVVVYLSDTDDRPIPAAGFKGNAIFVIGGQSQRFPLAPAEGSKLVGTAPQPVVTGTKGVVQLTAPDGTTAQGRF